jgi:uncharacterized protein (DUF924 family)
MESYNDVLKFWFGEGDADAAAPGQMGTWFGGSPEFDAEIRTRFLPTMEAAAIGRLEGWKETAEGRVAWALLLDQFTRNAYRGTARMFGWDLLALHSSREALRSGQDRGMPLVHRAFLLLPLEHSEELAAQRECVTCFEALVAEAPGELRGFTENMLDYARRHEVVIERFGRFPHRNEVLCRTSTAEELAFLASPAAPF